MMTDGSDASILLRGDDMRAPANRTTQAVVALALAMVGSACAVVPPRLPAPLPTNGVEVSAFGGATAGIEWDSDYSPGYSLAWGGANVAWQALAIDGLALELDAGAGVGTGHIRGSDKPYLGFSGGARVWHRWDSWAIGGDAGIVTTFPVTNRARIDTRFLPELRFLGALQLTDNVWLGTRPGLLVPLPLEIAYPVPLLDLPVALTVDWGPLRVGTEIGVCGLLGPTGAHAGVSVGLVL